MPPLILLFFSITGYIKILLKKEFNMPNIIKNAMDLEKLSLLKKYSGIELITVVKDVTTMLLILLRTFNTVSLKCDSEI